MKDSETKEKFIELRAEGLSFRKIAAEIGVSKTTLIEWSRDLAMEIQNAKSLRVDTLREQFLITKEAKIKSLSDSLDKMQQELSGRDFSDVPSEKLIALIARTQDQISKELGVAFSQKEDPLLSLYEPTTVKTWPA